LAGSEKGGAGAARAGLFSGERVVITPTGKTDPRAVQIVRELWEGVGARVFSLDPEEHDRILAAVSHLPHVISASLVKAVFRLLPKEEVSLAGAGSFRDLSRVTGSPPELWHDILTLNREPVLKALAAFRAALDELECCLREGRKENILDFFQKAKDDRDALEKPSE
jgi:prephenate dehydrogenase